VFEPGTISSAATEQSWYEIDWTLGVPQRWGLGLMLGGPVSVFGVGTSRAFGHLGFTNILGWADPERRLAVAIVNSGKPFVSLGTLPLVGLVMEIGRTFPRR
jgi:CubicO group peptidase (beta-lactamase class C family)